LLKKKQQHCINIIESSACPPKEAVKQKTTIRQTAVGNKLKK